MKLSKNKILTKNQLQIILQIIENSILKTIFIKSIKYEIFGDKYDVQDLYTEHNKTLLRCTKEEFV